MLFSAHAVHTGTQKLNSNKDKKMSKELSTLEQVSAIIRSKFGDEKIVTENMTFKEDLGADSLDTVELVMEFEKEFGITIPDEEAAKIFTVGDAVKYIDAHKASVKAAA